MAITAFNEQFQEGYSLLSGSVGSLNIIFSQIVEDGTVELVSSSVEDFFENLPNFAESFPAWTELFGETAQAAHGNWLLFKEFKKESIDPYQGTISRGIILFNFGWGFYKSRELNRELSLLRERLESDDFLPEEREIATQTYQRLQRQNCLHRMPVLQLPSLFFELPGSHPWQITAQLIQRTAAASFSLMDPAKSSIQKIGQATLDGIAITGSGLLLAKQLEVITSDDPTTNPIILATASVGYLHLTYLIGVSVSSYLSRVCQNSWLSTISSVTAAVSHGV